MALVPLVCLILVLALNHVRDDLTAASNNSSSSSSSSRSSSSSSGCDSAGASRVSTNNNGACTTVLVNMGYSSTRGVEQNTAMPVMGDGR